MLISTVISRRRGYSHDMQFIVFTYRIGPLPRRQCVCGVWKRKPTPTKREPERRKKKSKADDKQPGDGKVRFLSKWEAFSPSSYRSVPAWEVPWGWQTTSLGMLAWGASFLLAGIITIPLGIKFLGVADYKSMTALQQSQIQLFDQVRTKPHARAICESQSIPSTRTTFGACLMVFHVCKLSSTSIRFCLACWYPHTCTFQTYHSLKHVCSMCSKNLSVVCAEYCIMIYVLLQTASTIVGILLIKFISSRKEDQPPEDYLKVSPANPFRFPDGWASWAVLGLVTAPFAIVLSATVFSLLPQDLSTGRGTIDGVAGLVETVDPVVFLNLLIMSGVLAPILEETVFRGFLLTSLTKYMSLPKSVFLSSLIFAACHFSPRDFPQLLALGMVMGFAYARSRNLLTSITIHAVWNSTVVVMLFLIVNSGVSVQEILGE